MAGFICGNYVGLFGGLGINAHSRIRSSVVLGAVLDLFVCLTYGITKWQACAESKNDQKCPEGYSV